MPGELIYDSYGRIFSLAGQENDEASSTGGVDEAGIPAGEANGKAEVTGICINV